ncbi:myb-like protein X-like, partial [Trifolium medium]|nr:myb-like protein X-like [Trifolium medium]
TEDEMFKGDTQTSENDEKSDSSSVTDVLDSVVHDAFDSADTHSMHDVEICLDKLMLQKLGFLDLSWARRAGPYGAR